MRSCAYLKKAVDCGGPEPAVKIMLYRSEEGVYLFCYGSAEAVQSSSDFLYASEEELHDDWDGLIDERGWMDMDDPMPGCQHDAFIPLRVKGRDIGRPEWGRYETLKDGKWIGYDPG